jgi:hypothetical protein
LAAHRVKFFRTAHHRVAQVYLRFEKHALEGGPAAPSAHARSFPPSALSRRDGFPVLGYAQHSGALPSGFAGEAFSGVSFLHSLEGKKREGARRERLLFSHGGGMSDSALAGFLKTESREDHPFSG